MARSFAQVIAAMSFLGVILAMTVLETGNPLMGLFWIALPFLSGFMIVLLIKHGRIWQNREFALIAGTVLVLSLTQLFGDVSFMGYSLRAVGLMVAVGVELVLLFILVNAWELKGRVKL